MQTRAEARERADTGMQLATDKADRDQAGWSDLAYLALEKFCLAHPWKHFLTEDVREWVEKHGMVPAPENAKAWGSVMARAKREKLISSKGYAPARSSNLSPKVQWIYIP